MILKLKALLRWLNIKKNIIIVENNDDIILLNRNLDENIIPTFPISNTTAEGLSTLISFLSNLPVPSKHQQIKLSCKEYVQFDIHEALEVQSKIILAGIVANGRLLADKYFLGPDQNGEFK